MKRSEPNKGKKTHERGSCKKHEVPASAQVLDSHQDTTLLQNHDRHLYIRGNEPMPHLLMEQRKESGRRQERRQGKRRRSGRERKRQVMQGLLPFFRDIFSVCSWLFGC